MSTIDLTGLDKAEVLAALYSASKPQGMGFFHSKSGDMTKAQAAKFLAAYTEFDYLQGRVMKVDLSGETLDPRLYDRDNGTGAAAAALAKLTRKVSA